LLLLLTLLRPHGSRDPKAPQAGSDELCSSIDSHYDLDDLDDDWLMLLQQIDER
jgi:hypothetical protein